jgi:hypothetical protein
MGGAYIQVAVAQLSFEKHQSGKLGIFVAYLFPSIFVILARPAYQQNDFAEFYGPK